MWRAARWAPVAAAAAAPLLAPRRDGVSSHCEAKAERRGSGPLHRGLAGIINKGVAPIAPGQQHRQNLVKDETIQDELIEWLKKMLNHSFVLDMPETYVQTWESFEYLVEQHREATLEGRKSRLQEIVPSVGVFHTALPARDAWQRYDEKYYTSKRKMIAPSFNEIRHILNLAQVLAVAKEVNMITFDGDQTLYSDGANFSDAHLAELLIGLMQNGIHVVLLTAAGYGYQLEKYEARLKGLLSCFRSKGLTAEELQRFYVVGGECNYFMRCGADASLERVPDNLLRKLSCEIPMTWQKAEVDRVLDIAEATMREAQKDLHLRAQILRKERAVGIIPGGTKMKSAEPTGHGHLKLKHEALDEIAMRVMEALQDARPKVTLPYCSFNGGRDAWLDIGNKAVGVELLQNLLDTVPARTLHVGDQFLKTGNDIAARSVCPCIWIISPSETKKILELLFEQRGLGVPHEEVVASNAGNVYTGEGLGGK